MANYRIIRTETDLQTGIQHIANYARAIDERDARSLLYFFLTNAIKAKCKIEDVYYDGFTQHFGEFTSWKFEIAEYK